jgi:uncharacterized protein
LAFTYVALLGSAQGVTWVVGGSRLVRTFLAGYTRWRFSPARWALVVLGMPVMTAAVAVVSGTFQTPQGGCTAILTAFLLQTFVYGAAEVNLAEEGAWIGLVQSRFAAMGGVFAGALRTTPLFVAMHVPLQFTPGWTWPGVVAGVAVLLVIAPFFRYLLGETLHATGGSLLAVGIMHAAFNASGQMAFPGGWQFLPALIVLALAVGLHTKLRR